MSDTGYSHPELKRRWEMFVRECWARAWNPVVTSSSRSYEQQKEWYRLWRAGQWPTGPVANPDQFWGYSPWGMPCYGSLHMLQRDGYSHALDVAVYGPTVSTWHAVAARCGLRFPEPGENWHAQWWGNDGVYPVDPEMEEDMFSKQALLEALGRAGPHVGNLRIAPGDGPIEIRLSDDPAEPGREQWWPLADAVEFLHRHMKHIDTGK